MDILNSNYVLSEGTFLPRIFGEKKKTKWERIKDYWKHNKGRLGARLAGHMAGSAIGHYTAKKYGKDSVMGSLNGALLGQMAGEALYNKYKGQAWNSMDNRKNSDWHRA